MASCQKSHPPVRWLTVHFVVSIANSHHLYKSATYLSLLTVFNWIPWISSPCFSFTRKREGVIQGPEMFFLPLSAAIKKASQNIILFPEKSRILVTNIQPFVSAKTPVGQLAIHPFQGCIRNHTEIFMRLRNHDALRSVTKLMSIHPWLVLVISHSAPINHTNPASIQYYCNYTSVPGSHDW